MKSNFLRKTAVLCAGAVIASGIVAARADEPKKDDSTTIHHKKAVTKTQHATKIADKKTTGPGTIPTKDGRNSQYVPGRGVGGSTGPEYSVLTGSHIPRRYDQRGYTTNTYDDHFIYDQNDIRLQSARSPEDALRAIPGLTVRGGNR